MASGVVHFVSRSSRLIAAGKNVLRSSITPLKYPISYSSTGSSTPTETQERLSLSENETIVFSDEETGNKINSVSGEEDNNFKNKDDHQFAPFSANEDPQAYKKGTFQYLFEKSQFVQVSDPIEKDVKAEVIAIVDDKLYVDFGCKFHAVVPCRNPPENCIGKEVIVTVKDLEMSGHFVGDTRDKSLLEAEAKLLRFVH